MKLIKIGSKSAADKVLTNSLFNPVNGKTLVRRRYDSGKYKPDAEYKGREVEVHDDVHALYAVKQKDSDGPYVRIFCICEE